MIIIKFWDNAGSALLTSWFLGLYLLYAVVIWCSKILGSSCLRIWRCRFTTSETIFAVLEKGMIVGICSVFLFGLKVAIFIPQGSTVFRVSIQNCSRLSRNSLVSSNEAWMGIFFTLGSNWINLKICHRGSCANHDLYQSVWPMR